MKEMRSRKVAMSILVLIIMLATLATRGGCTRPVREKGWAERMFKSRLPRGPVPPSGPSPCHNRLSPYRQSQLSYTQEDICP
ncbi:hypothetical protein NMG60_11020617 [Bertholletia excelsa]